MFTVEDAKQNKGFLLLRHFGANKRYVMRNTMTMQHVCKSMLSGNGKGMLRE